MKGVNVRPLVRVLRLNDISYFASQAGWNRWDAKWPKAGEQSRAVFARRRRWNGSCRLYARVLMEPRNVVQEREAERALAELVVAMAQHLGYTAASHISGAVQLSGAPK